MTGLGHGLRRDGVVNMPAWYRVGVQANEEIPIDSRA